MSLALHLPQTTGHGGCEVIILLKHPPQRALEWLNELIQVRHLQPCQTHTECSRKGSYCHYASLFVPFSEPSAVPCSRWVSNKRSFKLNVCSCKWDQWKLTLIGILKFRLANISVCAIATELAPSPATAGMCTTAGHGVLGKKLSGLLQILLKSEGYQIACAAH